MGAFPRCRIISPFCRLFDPNIVAEAGGGGSGCGSLPVPYVDLAQRKNKLASASFCVIISYKRGFSVRRLFGRVAPDK